MGLFIVDHVFVDFIGNRETVIGTAEICNFLQFVTRKYLAEGVVWGIYDNRFCVSREGILEFGRIISKVDSTVRCWCLLQCDIDRFCTRDDRIRSVVLIKGFKDDNFVASVDDGEKRGKHAFSGTAGDSDVFIGVCRDVVKRRHFLGDCFSKGRCAPCDAILIISFLDRFNRGGFNFRRRLVRWRALRKVNRIVAQTELRHATDDGFTETGRFV